MKKIMFNDRYGLTQAVLEGRKTMTRRIAGMHPDDDMDNGNMDVFDTPKYKPGEVVAVAQSYEAIMDEMMGGNYGEGYGDGVYDAFRNAMVADTPGWGNKMFVRADLMPHQIRITNVRIERMQDITDEDCLREGIFLGQFHTYSFVGRGRIPFNTPREGFAALIDKVSGKGTWESNPYAFVYEFELVR